jgi:anti-sigma factor RsiW
MCLTDEILRAKLDGELGEGELHEVESHLAVCVGCHERAGIIARQAGDVHGILSVLVPPPTEAVTDSGSALARFKARRLGAEEEGPSLWGGLFAKRLRPAWGALAAACLIVVLVSFAPARTWAQKLLAMLRVQKITVIPVDLKALAGPNGETAAGKMLGQMISDNVVVTIHGEPRTAASADEASQRAGYRIRLLSDSAAAPQLTVEGEQAFHMTVDRERVQGILEELGHSELNLPASLDGATIAVHIPPAVVARYGNCPAESHHGESGPPPDNTADISDCVIVAQVPSPTVSVPPELNVAELAEAGLQVAGMSAAEAHTFCQTVDWTSTLVIPIPRSASSYKTVAVDGVEGTLINLPRERRHPAGYTLVWVKNGVIYSVMGFGNAADAVPLAETLN